MTMTADSETVSMTSFSDFDVEFDPEFEPDYVPTDLEGLSKFIGSPQEYVNALLDLWWNPSAIVVERVVTFRGHVYMEFYLPDTDESADVLRVIDRSIFHTAFCEHADLDEGHDESAGRFFRIPEGDWLYSTGFWGERALFLKN